MCPFSGGAAARPAIIIPEGEVEISVAVVRPDTELHHVPITFFFHIYFCRFVLNIYFCIFFLNIHLYDCEKFHVRFCTGPVRCDIYLLFFILLCLLLFIHSMTIFQLTFLNLGILLLQLQKLATRWRFLNLREE